MSPARRWALASVRIAVRACGVNFPDVLMIQGLYQLKPPFPFSPGLEVAGDIIEVAEDVQDLKVGERVMATMMYGGFAEEVVVPAESLLPMPPEMSYEHGAGFPLAYGTSHVALTHRAQLKAGETLLVLGAAGGVGLTAVELGKRLGARVIAAASTREKLELARAYGADALINYAAENLRDRLNELTKAEASMSFTILSAATSSTKRCGGSPGKGVTWSSVSPADASRRCRRTSRC